MAKFASENHRNRKLSEIVAIPACQDTDAHNPET